MLALVIFLVFLGGSVVESQGSCLEWSKDGSCVCCSSGWSGQFCNISCPACGQSYTNGTCHTFCLIGKYGTSCNQSCPESCKKEAAGDSICDKYSGKCLEGCTWGHYGSRCERKCDDSCRQGCDSKTGQCLACAGNIFGPFCRNPCSVTCINDTCEDLNGLCLCRENKTGSSCKTTCRNLCPSVNCLRNKDGTQRCVESCTTGFTGPLCLHPCQGCQTCSRLTGVCLGAVGPSLNKGSLCPKNCFEDICRSDGSCAFCNTGWYGEGCDRTCFDCSWGCRRHTGTCLRCHYGDGCNQSCPAHCKHGTDGQAHCDVASGVCSLGCQEGYTGFHCEVTHGKRKGVDEAVQPTTNGTPAIVGYIIAVVLVGGILVIVIICIRKRRRSVPKTVARQESKDSYTLCRNAPETVLRQESKDSCTSDREDFFSVAATMGNHTDANRIIEEERQQFLGMKEETNSNSEQCNMPSDVDQQSSGMGDAPAFCRQQSEDRFYSLAEPVIVSPEETTSNHRLNDINQHHFGEFPGFNRQESEEYFKSLPSTNGNHDGGINEDARRALLESNIPS